MHRLIPIVSLFAAFYAWIPMVSAQEVAPESDGEPALTVGQTRVSFGGIGKVQMRVQDGDDTQDEVGMRINGARLVGQATHEGLGGALVQIEAGNDISLLDVLVDVNLGTPVGLKAGYFKTPVSQEFLVGFGALPTFERAQLTRVAPRRRAGLDLYVDFDFGGWTLEADAGLFNPGNTFDLTQDGQLMVERVTLGLDLGLFFHVAYAQHVLGDNVDPETGGPLVVYDRLVDGAIGFERAGFRTLLEGVFSADAPGSTQTMGAYLMLAYVFGTSKPGEGFGYEPAIGLDWVDYDLGNVVRRVALNFNWLINGRKLMISLGYGAEQRDEDPVAHVGVLQFQGGF